MSTVHLLKSDDGVAVEQFLGICSSHATLVVVFYVVIWTQHHATSPSSTSRHTQHTPRTHNPHTTQHTTHTQPTHNPTHTTPHTTQKHTTPQHNATAATQHSNATTQQHNTAAQHNSTTQQHNTASINTLHHAHNNTQQHTHNHTQPHTQSHTRARYPRATEGPSSVFKSPRCRSLRDRCTLCVDKDWSVRNGLYSSLRCPIFGGVCSALLVTTDAASRRPTVSCGFWCSRIESQKATCSQTRRNGLDIIVTES